MQHKAIRITITKNNSMYETWLVVDNMCQVSCYFGQDLDAAKDKAVALQGILNSAGIYTQLQPTAYM